jgi:hypothetical protein
MAHRVRSFFSPTSWSYALLRGQRVFPAYGGLYVESTQITHDMRTRIEEKWPSAVEGKAYKRLSLPAVRGEEAPRLAVLISAVGRFGNAVMQSANAVFLSQYLRARDTLYFRFDAIHHSSISMTEEVTFRQIPLWRDRQKAPHIIWRTDAIYRGGLIFDPCEPKAQELAAALRVSLSVRGAPRVPEGHLTIHLRGGDVFGPDPHRDYGQPPLAFYLKVLESHSWKGVILVTEDDSNPCQDGIEDWCKTRSTPVLMRGKTSVNEAVEILGAAASVVLSNGSFGPAALFLNPRIRTVFFFGESPHPLLCSQGADVYGVGDSTGAYTRLVMAGNWSNDSDQRSLMMSYPATSLGNPEKQGGL